MAIYSAVPPPPGYVVAANTTANNQLQQHVHATTSASSSGQIGIEAWTVSALQSLSVSSAAQGIGAPLSIPLDEHTTSKPSVNVQDSRKKGDAITPPARPLSRRDSQRNRDAVLKGKEGSRQRRRWENDRLLHVPNVQPPEPKDWEPRPTHPVQHVPYQIAHVWDLRLRADVEKKRAVAARRKQQQTKTFGDDQVAGRVPREVFIRAKKTPAVKTWVRSLEEPVRQLLVDREVAKEADSESEDTEDEEIVFVGRNGSMRDGWKKAKREGQKEESGMVFDAIGDEESSAFKRWLIHSISDYYGLDSRSLLVGDPSRKVVYVGVKQTKTGQTAPVPTSLPRPLWHLC